ncbi:mitochondrial 54S ribosomal protein mL49 Ecym_2497 [Eremothecium cymbalariae DBVPG|uniref:Large ribosomal subunit protein mL49 n=1 Tax=Eremothecium cymbalariae (strain CBS 270.75 / DBVPG 7215 / KCTC 17166 / NRRL Y-17582) TaxID=931890 RepID=G8JPW1_ERECY|nr:Hypothetical protein Ecym_2497 [Eremothecium cymbalariae DBVPG\
MLGRNHRFFIFGRSKILRHTFIRLQTTNATPYNGDGAHLDNMNAMDNSPQSREVPELSAEFDTQNSSFSVFPHIRDVNPDQLVGSSKFGKNMYFISRSIHGSLPVYTDIKSGNAAVTLIKNVQGDIIQLRNDLQKSLPDIPRDSWKVLMQSRKIVISGDYVKAVKRVLSEAF